MKKPTAVKIEFFEHFEKQLNVVFQRAITNHITTNTGTSTF